ncbi:MAG: RNA pseudouridine synthase [Opitutales bacterium]|nr:RNA pseudouridine synthase [Opitutales bacterium]MCH8539191.1 RNA pseudouridine synthase [Opitutales bacterium]
MSVRASQEDWPLGKGVKVVGKDKNGLIALYKPAGILSHPNRKGEEKKSLLAVSYDPASRCYEGGYYLLNRLDSATTGLILISTDEEVVRAVVKEFEKQRVEKIYHALVFGKPSRSREKWEDVLRVERKSGQLRGQTKGGKGGLPATTLMRQIKVVPGMPPLTVLELQPLTGRTHQLRVQCSQRRLPIVGDQTYGQFQWNRQFARKTGRKGLHLHSAGIRLIYNLKGEKYEFSAKVNGDFL